MGWVCDGTRKPEADIFGGVGGGSTPNVDRNMGVAAPQMRSENGDGNMGTEAEQQILLAIDKVHTP